MSAFSHKLDQVTYPRMERQDLTQGQLGSFKFTPTDEVRQAFSAAPLQLVQQSTNTFGKDPRVDEPYMAATTASETQFLPYNLPHAANSPTRFGSTFFDKFIKPDLARSRLVLGPKALRTAVDGSPTKSQRDFRCPKEFDQGFRVDSVQTNMSTQDGNGYYCTSATDPFPTFTPQTQNDASLLHSSLVRALSAEQEAHQVTKRSWELEKSLRIQAEAEAQKYLEHNRSLIGSVNMLKSVIQHNMKKEEEASQRAEYERFHKEVNEASPKQTILHDAVKNLRRPEPKTVVEPTQSAGSIGHISRSEPAPASEHRPSMLPLASASWQKRYNKLIHEKNTSKPENSLASGPESAQQLSNVVSAGTSDSSQIFNFDLIESFGSPSLRSHFSTPVQEADKEMSPRSENNETQTQSTAEQSTRREKSDETYASCNTTFTTSSDKTNLTEGDFVVCEPESKDVAKSTKEELSTAGELPILMAMPFDAHVQWKQGAIFDNLQDKFSRLRDQHGIFSDHPVRYMPDKLDKNLYRTVMIDFVPKGTTCKEVLEVVRGGAVELIQLVGCIGNSTDFMTARVVFSYEQGARSVYKRGQNIGLKIKGEPVRAWQVLEATYPRTKELEKKIFEDGYTRILLIDNAIEASVDKLSQKLARQVEAGFVIEIGQAYDGLPMVEFTSIDECSKALDQLLKDPDFAGGRFDFEEDPCAGAYKAQ